jgi:hypothetical protein
VSAKCKNGNSTASTRNRDAGNRVTALQTTELKMISRTNQTQQRRTTQQQLQWRICGSIFQFLKEEDSYVEKKNSLSFSHVEREFFKVSHVRVQGVKKRECLGMVLGIT